MAEAAAPEAGAGWGWMEREANAGAAVKAGTAKVVPFWAEEEKEDEGSAGLMEAAGKVKAAAEAGWG